MFCVTNPSCRICASSSSMLDHGRMGALFRSSGGLPGSPLDQPPYPTNGNSGRRCSQARHTSEIVPARPPMTMHASPASAISRLRVTHSARDDHARGPVRRWHVGRCHDAEDEAVRCLRRLRGYAGGRAAAAADKRDAQASEELTSFCGQLICCGARFCATEDADLTASMSSRHLLMSQKKPVRAAPVFCTAVSQPLCRKFLSNSPGTE
jgi:hypothetical protein